jgi:hypothetical protein
VYLTGEQVRTVLSQLSGRFEQSMIAFDTAGAVMLRNQHRNGSMHAVSARMQWVCENPHEVEQWGPELLQTRTFATPQPEVANGWPARYRYGIRCWLGCSPPSSTATNSTCSGSAGVLNKINNCDSRGFGSRVGIAFGHETAKLPRLPLRSAGHGSPLHASRLGS